MKNLFFFLCLALSPALVNAQNDLALSTCCSGENAKCTGSSYCRACTNCSRCGHCNSGGSCGVCSGSASKSRKTSSSGSGSTSSGAYTAPLRDFYLANDIESENYLKTLVVNTETLNLRSGPGANYFIKAKLKQKDELIFLAMTGDWVKVRTKGSRMEGYVSANYVLVTEE